MEHPELNDVGGQIISVFFSTDHFSPPSTQTLYFTENDEYLICSTPRRSFPQASLVILPPCGAREQYLTNRVDIETLIGHREVKLIWNIDILLLLYLT